MSEKKYYWLGPGVFGSHSNPIKIDQKIPAGTIENMSENRLESLIAEKKIGFEPRSAALQKAADIAGKEIIFLQNEREKLVEEFMKKIEVERAETKKAEDLLKQKIAEYKIILSDLAAIKKERDKLLEKLAKANDDRKKAIDDYKGCVKENQVLFKENNRLKKLIKD